MKAPALRPMTVADLVDEIFRLYRANPPVFFGVSAVIWLPASIALFVLNYLYFRDLPVLNGTRILTPQQLTDSVSSLFAALAIAIIIGVFAAPVLLGALTAVVSARYLGRPITIGDALRRAFACYARIVASYAIVILAAAGASLGIAVIGSIVAAVIGGLPGILLAVIAVAGAVVAFFWVITTWALTGQAIVVEDAGVLGSLGRSRALVSGSRWRVIGINSLLYLIQIVLFTVPSTIVAVLTAPLPAPLGPALAEVITSVAQIAYFPIQLGTLTLLYYDLRVRREGFDLALAAEHLAPA